MSARYNLSILLLVLVTFSNMTSCKKFTDVGAPKNALVTNQVFSTDASANAAIAGIYYQLSNGSLGQGYTTLYTGLSADEANKNNISTGEQQLLTDGLTVDNTYSATLWSAPYAVLAQANACLEGLAATDTSTIPNKKQYVAEAKFIRAFCNFYLVNLFGNIPLVTTANWTSTVNIARTTRDSVYNTILQDLGAALTDLPESYPSGQPIRATKYAATAMLARVSLYLQRWTDAANYATQVIDGMNIPLPAPENTFLIGSPEAIWQLEPVGGSVNPFETSQWYAFGFLSFFLTDQMAGAFETGDLRQAAWVGMTNSSGVNQYYPTKYKGSTYSQPAVEYYMVLRLAEQYLIRAEARARQNDVADALADLDIIRSRAGLSNLPAGLDKAACLLAVEQERRVELFAEWGHRWLDLKRTGRAIAVLQPLKPKITTDALLYPVPASEIQKNKNLLPQNAGY